MGVFGASGAPEHPSGVSTSVFYVRNRSHSGWQGRRLGSYAFHTEIPRPLEWIPRLRFAWNDRTVVGVDSATSLRSARNDGF
jgi:hypothetical protein